ncbi:MAG: hypothetical protein E6G79_03510 [Alphaproteobacteria bacterium]|nr:MAG: hypothetical protein E6G79_03510 [Alphaproteobacteria bacterium]
MAGLNFLGSADLDFHLHHHGADRRTPSQAIVEALMTTREIAVKNIRDCRAMSSLFRQFAVFDPVHSSKYLIEAQRWEHLAEAEITSHFKECNTTGSATARTVSPAP